MTTGFTYDVEDGTLTDFKKFALRCAHVVGYNGRLRDHNIDSDIPHYQPGDYQKKQLENAKARLYDAERMTLEDAYCALGAEYTQRAKDVAAYRARRAERHVRIVTMIEKVDAWVPPTRNHHSLKDFMLDQLRMSLPSDDESYAQLPLQSPRDYRQELIDEAKKDIARCLEDIRKEEERVDQCNAWNKALFESLGLEPPKKEK